MADDDGQFEQHQRGRETFLAVILTVLVGGSFALFLIFVTGGFFLWVVLICLGLGLFIVLHYLLWGRRFERAVQGEREELEAEREAEERAQDLQRPPWERRF
jgi:hypothetical protein